MTSAYADSGVLPSGISRVDPPTSNSAIEHFFDKKQSLNKRLGSGINVDYPSPVDYQTKDLKLSNPNNTENPGSGIYRSYQLQTPNDGEPPRASGNYEGTLTEFENNKEGIANKERSILAPSPSGLESEFSNALASKQETEEINDFTIFNTYKHYYSVIVSTLDEAEVRFIDVPPNEEESRDKNNDLKPLEMPFLSTAKRSTFIFNRYPELD